MLLKSKADFKSSPSVSKSMLREQVITIFKALKNISQCWEIKWVIQWSIAVWDFFKSKTLSKIDFHVENVSARDGAVTV